MIHDTTNQARNDDHADAPSQAVSAPGGDEMTNSMIQALSEIPVTGEPAPETRRSPGSEEPKPARPKGSGKNGYPFRTKRQIVAQLEQDAAFRHECLLVLYRRQTEDEQECKETRYKNRRGFMSSHAVNGSRLAQKILDGETLTPEDEGKIEGIVCRYGKQLAAHFRNEKLAQAPDLAEKAAVYFMG